MKQPDDNIYGSLDFLNKNMKTKVNPKINVKLDPHRLEKEYQDMK